MNRRKFLTQAGVTSIALASLPALATRALAAPERGQMGFHFMVISFSPPTSDLVPDTLVMAGAGDFTSQQVVGSGIFNLLKAAAGARFSWGRAGIATKMRYAFGLPRQGFQRRPMPDAMRP